MFVWSISKCSSSAWARTQLLCVATAFSLCIPGCGDSGPRMVPVSGTVSVNGKPTEAVEVYFVHENLVTMGTTDSQGHYDLVTGAATGENKVYFSKIEGGARSDDATGMQDAGSGGAKRKQLIPAQYSNANEPKITFEVPRGGSKSADFDLK